MLREDHPLSFVDSHPIITIITAVFSFQSFLNVDFLHFLVSRAFLFLFFPSDVEMMTSYDESTSISGSLSASIHLKSTHFGLLWRSRLQVKQQSWQDAKNFDDNETVVFSLLDVFAWPQGIRSYLVFSMDEWMNHHLFLSSSHPSTSFNLKASFEHTYPYIFLSFGS